MNRHRLLLVEDEAIVALDIGERLAGLGYQLLGHAATGEAALELTRTLKPDLVLMDIRLEGDMDGIDAAREIRRRFHVPVIFITAYSADETLERAKLADPYGYLLKPFEDRELKSAVEIALYRHRTEEEIRHLNRLYDVLSQVNQTVVRVHSREELLSEVCRVMVERGGADLAWIGSLDPATALISPVAQAGTKSEFLSRMSFSADPRPEVQGNPGRAIRAGAPAVCNHCAPGNCPSPVALSPEQCGFHSCGSFPLQFQGQVFGVLTLCVSESDFFGPREIALLEEVARDISFALDKIEADAQSRQFQEEIKRQSAFLATLLDALPYPVFYKDAQFRYLGCNAAFEAFQGTSRDRLTGQTVQDLWPREEAEVYQRADQELLANPALQIYEITMSAADGARHDVILHKAVFRNPDGNVGGIIGVVEDITRRKASEEALRESEEKFRQATEIIEEGVWEWRLDSGELYISPGFLRQFGYDPHQVEHTYDFWLTAVHPEDLPAYQEALEAYMAGRRPTLEVEFRAKTGHGHYRWFIDRGQVVERNPDGTPLRLVGALRDITESKRARTALEESLSLYRATLESTADGLLAVNNKGRIVSWNRKFAEMWRLPQDLQDFRDNETVRQSVAEQLLDPQGFLERARELFAHPADEAYDLLHFKDGRVFERYSIPQYLNGRIAGRVLSFRDVTIRVRTEQTLRHSEAFLNSVIEYSPYAMWIADANGTLIRLNQACRELLQISEAEVVGKYNVLRDNILEEQGVLSQVHKVFEKGESVRFTLHYESARLHHLQLNKTVDVILDVTISPVLDEQGQIVNVIVQHQDITARLRAEGALKESEARYRRIVETANEGIWAMDGKLCTTFVNRQMAAMLGYDPGEMIGRPVTYFIHPEELADHQDKMAQRRRGEDDNYERRFRRKDGSDLWTIVSVRALTGEAGEFLGSFAMFTDITQRKQAEEALKNSEKRVRAKLDSILAPAGDIAQLDLEDIIDTGALQSLMEDFHRLIRIPMALIDLQGKVLVRVGGQEICTRFHRAHPAANQQCLDSQAHLTRDLPPGTFKISQCQNHLWDVATPVMVGDRHLGNLFMGQFLFADEALDLDLFRAQAREFGFEEAPYLAALDRVPRLDREKVENAISFFTKLAHMISLLSLSNLKLARAVGEQERLVESLRLSEEKSRAGEEFLSDVFNSIKDGLTILDLDRTIIRVNPAVEHLATTRDLAGRKCYEAFHQRDRVCPNCPVEHTLRTGEANQAILEADAVGWKAYCIELHSYPLINRSTGELRGVIEYGRDISESKRAQEALSEKHRELEETAQELEQSRNMLQLVLESIPVRVFWKDRESRVLGCNTLFARDAGLENPQQLLGLDDFAMGWKDQAELYRADDRQVMESDLPKMNLVEPQTTPGGATIWLSTSKVPLRRPTGEVFGVLGVYEDITELKEKEDQLRASLAEKEVMLKEIHHRVKNNMQMISTLFDLQLKYGGAQDPPTVFRDCQNRIRSMALIHESLYHTDTLASIDFRRYLEKLVNRLLISFGTSVQGVRARVTGGELHLGINQAVPAGLVASELLVNCLKHAFPEQRPGAIEINLEVADDQRIVVIKDNGVGLGPDLSLINPTSFGWLMISNLMKQLEGTITVTGDGGTTCRMVF